MAYSIVQESAAVWALAEKQHGVVTRAQLLGLGYAAEGIQHRIAKRRLHPVWRGVYAVGRPDISRQGWWMAAVLACGPDAVLSHESAAGLWEIRQERRRTIEVSVPAHVRRSRPGIVVHRRADLAGWEVERRHRIRVTSVVCTLVDLATSLPRDEVEASVNEADKLGLIDPEALRSALDGLPEWRGVVPLRETLDRRTFTLTRSKLERLFLPVARRSGLGLPLTQRRVNGFLVDFYWPALGLVVETDGLTYHRTPTQQTKDRVRDQAHTAAGLTTLRFTHAQVAFEPGHVEATLAAVARRLQRSVPTRSARPVR